MLLVAALLVSIAGTLAYPGGYLAKNPREILLVPQEEANPGDTSFYDMDPKTTHQVRLPREERKESGKGGWGSGGSNVLSSFYAPFNPYYSPLMMGKTKDKDKDTGETKHVIHYPDGSMYELTSSGELKPIFGSTESGSGSAPLLRPPSNNKSPPTVLIIKVPYPVDYHHHPHSHRPPHRPMPYYPSWYHYSHGNWWDRYYPHYHHSHYHSHPYNHHKRPYVSLYLPQHSGYAPGYDYQSDSSPISLGINVEKYPYLYAPPQPWYGQGGFDYGGNDHSHYYDGSGGNSWWPSEYNLKKKPATTDSKTKKEKTSSFIPLFQ